MLFVLLFLLFRGNSPAPYTKNSVKPIGRNLLSKRSLFATVFQCSISAHSIKRLIATVSKGFSVLFFKPQ